MIAIWGRKEHLTCEYIYIYIYIFEEKNNLIVACVTPAHMQSPTSDQISVVPSKRAGGRFEAQHAARAERGAHSEFALRDGPPRFIFPLEDPARAHPTPSPPINGLNDPRSARHLFPS